MISVNELHELSQEIRGRFETHAYTGEDLAVLNPALLASLSLASRARYLHEIQAKFPKGNCGIASAVMLAAVGTGARVYGSYICSEVGGSQYSAPHMFLSVETQDNGPVIANITADQFGGPSIYVGKLVLPWSMDDAG